MNKNPNRLCIIIIIMMVLNFCLKNSLYFWVKFDGWWLVLSRILMFFSFIGIIAATINFITRIIKDVAWRKLPNYLLAGIAVLYVLLAYFVDPLVVDENTFQSPVKICACYEGTMNTSRLFFRENGTFEDYNIGFFAHVFTQKGTYMQRDDSLFLKFTKGGSGILGDTIIIRDSMLYKIQADTTVHTYYYLGECRGLN